MAAADFDGNDIFADGTDLHTKPYKQEDRDAEAAKIARLRRLRLARCAGESKKSQPRFIMTR
jgi:hypothetical protein